MLAYNFGDSRRNLTKFYQGRWLEAWVIKCTLILQEVPRTKFGRAKCPKFGTIFDNFWLWLRISSERIDISKIWIALDQLTTFHPLLGKKNWWTLVH